LYKERDRYVLAIAGSSSMREAASKLFVSQPALSATIHELEEELGIKIFERSRKKKKLPCWLAAVTKEKSPWKKIYNLYWGRSR